MDIQKKVADLLEDAGIGLEPEAIIAAGFDGLTAVSGIGPKTASDLLDTAKATEADPAPRVVPHLPAEEPVEPDPTAIVEITLVGLSAAVVEGFMMIEGHTRKLPYANFKTAAAPYPKGTFTYRVID